MSLLPSSRLSWSFSGATLRPGAPRIPDEAIVGFSLAFALAVTATMTVEPLTIREAGASTWVRSSRYPPSR